MVEYDSVEAGDPLGVSRSPLSRNVEADDPLGVSRSPLIRPAPLTQSPANSENLDPDTWSVLINQFFPLNCNETPTLIARFVRDSTDSSASLNLSPRLNLAPISEEDSVFQEVSELDKSEKSEDCQ